MRSPRRRCRRADQRSDARRRGRGTAARPKARDLHARCSHRPELARPAAGRARPTEVESSARERATRTLHLPPLDAPGPRRRIADRRRLGSGRAATGRARVARIDFDGQRRTRRSDGRVAAARAGRRHRHQPAGDRQDRAAQLDHDFEPNYLPFVEFYDEDFPWRYTPAPAGAASACALARAARADRGRVRRGDASARRCRSAGPIIEIDRATRRVFRRTDQTLGLGARRTSSRTSPTTSARHSAQAVDALEALIADESRPRVRRLLCPRKLAPTPRTTPSWCRPSRPAASRASARSHDGAADELAPAWAAGRREYPVLLSTGTSARASAATSSLSSSCSSRAGARSARRHPRHGHARAGFGVPAACAATRPVDRRRDRLEGALASRRGRCRDPSRGRRPSATTRASRDAAAEGEPAADRSRRRPAGDPRSARHACRSTARWHAQKRPRAMLRARRLAATSSTAIRGCASPAGFGTGDPDRTRRTTCSGPGSRWAKCSRRTGASPGAARVERWACAVLRKHVLAAAAATLLAVTAPVHARVMGARTTIRQQVQRQPPPERPLEPRFRRLLRPRGRDRAASAAGDPVRRPSDLVAATQRRERPRGVRRKLAPPRADPRLNDVARGVMPSWVLPALRLSAIGSRGRCWSLMALAIAAGVRGRRSCLAGRRSRRRLRRPQRPRTSGLPRARRQLPGISAGRCRRRRPRSGSASPAVAALSATGAPPSPATPRRTRRQRRSARNFRPRRPSCAHALG